MKVLALFSILLSGQMFANNPTIHKMQHGFILSDDNSFGFHLVARGHHSRQTVISGELAIADLKERDHFDERKKKNQKNRNFYFLFQAQLLDLPSTRVGQVLKGHIIESEIGSYRPNKKIVSKATFTIEKIYLNLVNPFFKPIEGNENVNKDSSLETFSFLSNQSRGRSCSVICKPITMRSDSCQATCTGTKRPICKTYGSDDDCRASCYCKGGR